MALCSWNPATGELLAEYPEHTDAEVAAILDAACVAWRSWRREPVAARAAALTGAATVLADKRAELARLISLEMGKPIVEAAAEVDKCALVCGHYAEMAAEYLAPQPVATDATTSYVRYDPLGPVLGVMPWNFPLWQVFRYAAPALVAGNVALLKHASNVSGCARAIELVLRQGGLPPGCFAVLRLGADRVGAVVADERVRAVSCTGSGPAGRAVASLAGAHLKKVVLELGGSDPFVVLADADVATAAETAVRSRMINSGQSCIAAKRLIVVREVLEEFTSRVMEAVRSLVVGDPLDETTEVGPLARADLCDELDRQVRMSVAAGAQLLEGGRSLPGPGWFYEPTVLAGVAPAHAVAAEETFGPVAAIMAADDEEHALELANGTPFGLGASVWTRDASRHDWLAERLDCGSVFVNDLVKSDPRLPFGGVKASGHGRELGRHGLLEFANVKSVWIRREG